MRLLYLFIYLFLQQGIIKSQTIDSSTYYYNNLKYEKSINYLKNRINHNKYKNSGYLKSVDLHNLACSYSLIKNFEKCIETINIIIKNDTSGLFGYYDKDFYYVSQTKEWRDLLINYKHKRKIKLSDTLFLDLIKIAINDQVFYNDIEYYKKNGRSKSAKYRSLWNEKDSLNKQNLKLVNYYLNKNINVLSDSVVGKSFATNCFLVIQHSDIKTQELFLPVIKQLYYKKEARGEDYALLYDRVSVKKNGGIQYYGSQINSETHEPYPIKDERNVDKRRAKLGMEPLFEYLLKFGIQYKPKH